VSKLVKGRIGNCKIEAVADGSTVHFVADGPVAELHRLAAVLKGTGYKVERDPRKPNTLYIQGVL